MPTDEASLDHALRVIYPNITPGAYIRSEREVAAAVVAHAKAEALEEAAADGLPSFGSQSEFHKGRWTTYYTYTQRIEDWLLARAAKIRKEGKA